jgi:uncharacterized metal-binding protein YceD (DUF177 family)
MNKDLFIIYIERLKNEHVEKIEETIAPDFLEIEENELSFKDPVHMKGRAYLTNKHLILDLQVKTSALLPCAICNLPTPQPIEEKLTLTVELSDTPSQVYDFSEDLRTALLLTVPQFIECEGGSCPHRKETEKYFSEPKEKIHTPFSDLD